MKPEELNLSENILRTELSDLSDENKIELSSMWLHNVPAEKREAYIQMLRHSVDQFDKLRYILHRLYRQAQSHEEDIDSPNWRDRAAFNTGYKKALRDLYSLIPKTRKE